MRKLIPLDEFIAGSPEVPRLLMSDAYTVGSWSHSSNEADEESVYHIVSRRGLKSFMPPGVAKDDRIVFAGLQRIIRDILTEPVTMAEIRETDKFLRTFHAGGSKFVYPREMWVDVVQDFDGIIPIKIEAMRTGDVAFPGEPMIQVYAKDGFGELAAWFESNLVHVWAATERLTAARWWRSYLFDTCRLRHPNLTDEEVDNIIDYMCHDFGGRAAICQQESEVLGGIHTLVFKGTDTTSGAYVNWKDNGGEGRACSIHALSHRIVMGFDNELDAHEELYEYGPSITAHVSDTNDFYKMTEVFAKKLSSGSWSDGDHIVVNRPDSGCVYECVNHIIDMCEKYNLFTVGDDGLKRSTRMRCICGDSMNWEKMIKVIDLVTERGWSPFFFLSFGVGGFLRDSISRGHLGVSMKLASVDGVSVAKKSLDSIKSSIPGVVSVLRNEWPSVKAYSDSDDSMLEVWYDGQNEDTLMNEVFLEPCLETPNVVSERVLNNFMDRSNRPDGINVMSDDLIQIRENIFTKQAKGLLSE